MRDGFCSIGATSDLASSRSRRDEVPRCCGVDQPFPDRGWFAARCSAVNTPPPIGEVLAGAAGVRAVVLVLWSSSSPYPKRRTALDLRLGRAVREPGLVDWTRAHTAWENGGSAVLQVWSPLHFLPSPFSAAGRQLFDRPHQTAGQRVHAPRRGAGRLWGTATGGVRFARPPAHFCDPYRGRSAAMAAWGARRHGSPDLCVRPVGRVSQPVSTASPTKNHRRPARKPASRERRRTARTNFQICPTRPRTSVSVPLRIQLPNLVQRVAKRVVA
jgi:hypothetical protein